MSAIGTKMQCPEEGIQFVFNNTRQKKSKGSKKLKRNGKVRGQALLIVY
jgi:hypothetical protein